jgi:hypothetical protein
MRYPGANNPSIISEIGSLAGLYRTVFWMMGRKARYGRLWPPEAEMPSLQEEQQAAPPPVVIAPPPRHLVEVNSRD